MAIYRASDSMSRCDPNQYSSIYDVRKRSDVKHEPIAATRPIHKDTIEISRDKLKEEALNRLRHTSKYVIAQNGFMRVGKYLFLAVAFPPYFIIYGLPKWILVEGMPAIFSMSLWMWKKIQHRTQRQIEVVNRKAVQMVQLVQNILQLLMQPIVHLALHIRQRIRRFRDRSLQILRGFALRFKQTLHLPRLKLSQRLQNVQERFLTIKEKLSKRAQQVKTRIQQGIQWIKESPQIIYGWGQIQLQRLNQQISSLSLRWKNSFHTPHQLAQRATDWIAKGVKNCLRGLKKPFAPLVNFYQEKWLPRWHKLKNTYIKKWSQTRNFFQHKHQRAFVFLHTMQEKLKQVTSDRLIQYFLSHPWVGKRPVHFQEWLKKCFAHPFIRTLCDAGVKCYTRLVSALLQLAKLILQIVGQASTLIMKGCNLFQSTIKFASQSVLSILNVGQKLLHKSALYVLFYFLLFLTIIFILLIWGMRSLSNYTSSLFSHFSIKKRMVRLKG